jgi:hypothetical protein
LRDSKRPLKSYSKFEVKKMLNEKRAEKINKFKWLNYDRGNAIKAARKYNNTISESERTKAKTVVYTLVFVIYLIIALLALLFWYSSARSK